MGMMDYGYTAADWNTYIAMRAADDARRAAMRAYDRADRHRNRCRRADSIATADADCLALANAHTDARAVWDAAYAAWGMARDGIGRASILDAMINRYNGGDHAPMPDDAPTAADDAPTCQMDGCDAPALVGARNMGNCAAHDAWIDGLWGIAPLPATDDAMRRMAHDIVAAADARIAADAAAARIDPMNPLGLTGDSELFDPADYIDTDINGDPYDIAAADLPTITYTESPADCPDAGTGYCDCGQCGRPSNSGRCNVPDCPNLSTYLDGIAQWCDGHGPMAAAWARLRDADHAAMMARCLDAAMAVYDAMPSHAPIAADAYYPIYFAARPPIVIDRDVADPYAPIAYA